MLKELSEHPNREYKSECVDMTICMFNGNILYYTSFYKHTYLLLDSKVLSVTDWEQIKPEPKEVDFIEAIASNKKIKLKFEYQYSEIGIITNHYKYSEEWFCQLSNYPSSVYTELIKSKWLIKPDESEGEK